MRPRTFVFITVLINCHLFATGQALTNALPPAQSGTGDEVRTALAPDSVLPDDPEQESLPIAQPEPQTAAGVPVSWKSDRQTWVGHTATLYGVTEFRYRDYVLSADKIVYNQETAEVEAEGNLQVSGGPEDMVLTATHGDLRINEHTARFYDVTGTMGVRSLGRSTVYSTPNPFVVHARLLLQTAQGTFRVIDGTMTNCRLPKPDWQLIAHSIQVAGGHASSTNTYFRFLGVPMFYFPYLRHPIDESGRQSGFLIPNFSNSTIRGYTLGDQIYVVLNRSMDMVIGTEYYSKRGWAPNGDFRYRGPGLDHLTVRWNALFDRGILQPITSGQQAGQMVEVNQGGADILAMGREDISAETRLAGNAEFLNRYIYRLVFSDNYWQAVSSEVKSEVSLTHAHNGLIPSADIFRLQSFASPAEGDEVRILRLPSVRFDVLNRPLRGTSANTTAPFFYWGLESSISHIGRSEPNFHAHNEGRFDLFPHLSLAISSGGWSIHPEAALRATYYSGSQVPDLTGDRNGTPSVSHETLLRAYAEAFVDLRPPPLARDFNLGRWNRYLRHVIEPELTYHFVGGMGSKARRVLLSDTTDIASDTNEFGFSLTQRLYLRALANQPGQGNPCAADPVERCTPQAREWASWMIAQKYYLSPNFGGALIPGRRNVFDSTLDLSGIAFLTVPRNLSPVTSRLRFEAIENLRIQWDIDYDPKAGRIGANNIFGGYSYGKTTVGMGHSLLNAVDEHGIAASLIQSDQIEPFLQIGKPNATGFSLAANGGYNFVHGALQYAGIQAAYNWNCCGLTFGYRRFALGPVRDETQYLYSFTLANFGSVGDIRRSNSVFRDSAAPPSF